MLNEYWDEYPYYQIKPKYFVTCDYCGVSCTDWASDDKEEMNDLAEGRGWMVDSEREFHLCPKCRHSEENIQGGHK